MWQSIKREFSVNRDGLWQSGLILAGACLLGEGITAVIMHIFKEGPAFVPLGMICTAGTAFVCGLIFPAFYFSCGYEQALTMGCTRGRFLAGALALSLVHILLMFAAALLAALADIGFYRVFYPQVYARIDWADFPSPGALFGGLALAAAALLCTGLFFGACLQRWGKRAFWILYGAGMSLLFLSGPLSHWSERAAENSLLGRMMSGLGKALSQLPEPAAFGFCGAAVLAGGVFGAVLLLRGSLRHAM